MIQNGRISPGKYILPFDIELPEFQPSSVRESGNGKTVGSSKIIFTIKAILKGSGMLYNYKCDRIIFVKAQPLERVVRPFKGEPSTAKVQFYLCFHRGTMIVGAHMEDTMLDRGQTTKLSLSCRNNSTASVEDVEAKLVQITRWYAGGRANERQRILQAMSFILRDWIARVRCLSEVNPNDKTR
jgi:hypothetical protein